MKPIFTHLPFLGLALVLPFITQFASASTYQDPVSSSRPDAPGVNQQTSSPNVGPTATPDAAPTTGTPNIATSPTILSVPQTSAPELMRDVHPSISKYSGIHTALNSEPKTSSSTKSRTKNSSRSTSTTTKRKPTKSPKPFFDNHMVPPYAWAYDNRTKGKNISTKTSDTTPSTRTSKTIPTGKPEERKMLLHPPSRLFPVVGTTTSYLTKAVDVTSSTNTPEPTTKSI